MAGSLGAAGRCATDLRTGTVRRNGPAGAPVANVRALRDGTFRCLPSEMTRETGAPGNPLLIGAGPARAAAAGSAATTEPGPTEAAGAAADGTTKAAASTGVTGGDLGASTTGAGMADWIGAEAALT